MINERECRETGEKINQHLILLGGNAQIMLYRHRNTEQGLKGTESLNTKREQPTNWPGRC